MCHLNEFMQSLGVDGGTALFLQPKIRFGQSAAEKDNIWKNKTQ